MTVLTPGSGEEVAEILREHSERDESLLVRGGGSKAGWGTPIEGDPDTLSTTDMSGIVELNEGDMTATLGAGTPLAEASKTFASAEQMLAIDPWWGQSDEATIGGVIATADSGPLRHRYAAPRDLVLGIQLATADGTLARAGSRVIKNVAGYDLAKLFTGSYGTLGVITEVIVRLHPLPRERATVIGTTSDAGSLGRALLSVISAPLELESLDIAWDREGRLLARVAGAATQQRVEYLEKALTEHGLQTQTEPNDDDVWERQRRSQRSDEGATIRISARPSETPRVISAVTACNGCLVGRGGYGLYWAQLSTSDPDEVIAATEEVRARLQPYTCVLLDAPEDARRKLDVWHSERVGGLEVMRSVKSRFDPKGTCNPGVFVGGI